ncbi:hypothetical protein VTK73DRAFT_3814 [Phialemonium thermophilum]|uniref:Uncharacterized protein n=1 Tax=Phialemonium thermophilum TaxID=223376 RepID=A0ABR3WX08_9PEZI
MPPYVPRKRGRSSSPPPKHDSDTPKPKQVIAPPRKSTLFDDLDASSSPRSSSKTGKSATALLQESDEEDSSLSSLSDADFEDVPLAKKLKLDREKARGSIAQREKNDDAEEEDEDLEFEDVHVSTSGVLDVLDGPVPSGDLELTLNKDTRISLTNFLDKKGPSKLERKIRIAMHCAHVQLLLWHNAIRNCWLCDSEVQGLLLSHLPPSLWAEVDRWKRSSGLEVPEAVPKKVAPSRARGKGKAKDNPSRRRPSRDWGHTAQRLEEGVPDMSHGDPLFRLMKVLSAWWKQRFRVSAPGLRKLGYMSLERLDRLTKAYASSQHDAFLFGERIESLQAFRRCAQDCSGSRDVGSQLFTALVRALGLEARMVASLQPLGFGWNKLEDAEPEKEVLGTSAGPSSDLSAPTRSRKSSNDTNPVGKNPQTPQGRRTRQRNQRDTESASTDLELQAVDSDDESIIELPQERPSRKTTVAYDKDLEFPHYWTEVLSPVTHKYLPVDPIVKSIVATKRELVEALEPRGAKADKARQVIAYVVGFSPDGTAKDVTVRYLKRQVFPGRTKGARLPVEKIPIHNRYGKVARYEQFDWFKTVMRGYGRGDQKHPVTEIDEEEEATDLKPAIAEKKEVKEGEETLQYYKQSTEFVLERHLKREEALLPTAVPVRVFKNKGKGADAREEPVYSRKDVVQVKSAETWHKQGRAPLPGVEPLKRVPYRAATTNRRREIAEAEAATGEKVLQGLYSFDQTDWIIPPPIQNGIIPKNEYGNIDLFVEHMCPQGAVHVPYRGAVRVCKRLQIDYAEAVVGFEFGHRMAVPVIQGVVIAEEYYDRVMEELAKDEAERRRKEDEKRKAAALGMWRKLLMGMRIVERIHQDYGGTKDDIEVFRNAGNTSAPLPAQDDEEMAGGFLPEGYVSDKEKESHQYSGFFPVAEEDEGLNGADDILQVDHGSPIERPSAAYPTPQSALSTKSTRGLSRVGKGKGKAKPSQARRRKRRAPSTTDEEDESLSDLLDSDE